MANVLCVGFGGMGCRHTQSLLGVSPKLNIFVLEPNEEIFQANSARIGAKIDDLTAINSLDDLTIPIDFAIVATSAQPRFELMKSLLAKGIKQFLVEKVVFQSAAQFKEITALLEKYNAQAYCNFVNRYFPNYLEIKSRLQRNQAISMVVSGGDFGLACNALHYVDLFEFITGNSAILADSKMDENEIGNRRGNIYKEVTGQQFWRTSSGDSLFISAEKTRTGGNEILITQGETIDILNEEALTHFHYSKENDLISNKFNLLYTSSLTKIIYEDILKNKTLLPTIQETEKYHVQFFGAINQTLRLPQDAICPIT